MTGLATTRAIERSGGHLYTYREGDQTFGPFPGATAITKLQDSLGGNDGLMRWGIGLALDELQRRMDGKTEWDELRSAAFQAMNRPSLEGTAIHEAVDRFNKDMDLNLTPLTAPYVAHYASALRREGIHVLSSERYVVNLEIGSGGTYDSLVEIDGERGPLDVKSGKEKPSQRLQLTGLSMGQYHGEAGMEAEPMPEMSGVGFILLLRPDGYELVRHEITDEDRAHFIHLVETFHRIKGWASAFTPTPLREDIAA
jgi:hypothetical protein